MIKIYSILGVLFLGMINVLVADFSVKPQIQSHQEMNYEIVYNAQGQLIGVDFWTYNLQVPIIDGMVWWPDAVGYTLYATYDLKQPDQFIVSSQEAQTLSTVEPPKIQQKSLQMHKPKIEQMPPEMSRSTGVVYGDQIPQSVGMYARVKINSNPQNASRVSSMSDRDFANWWCAQIAYQKYCRMKYHMTPQQKDKLMSTCRYKKFAEKLLSDDTLADEVVLELWQQFCDLKKYSFGDDQLECEKQIKNELKRRQERRADAAKVKLENICQAKAVQIQQELDEKYRKQIEEFERVQQELLTDERRFLQEAYELPECWLQDVASVERSVTRQRAVDQTQLDDFMQHEVAYCLTPRAKAYLKLHDFDPADYGYFLGTALQQQFHQEIISGFERVADLGFQLPCRSNLLQSSLLLADAAHEANQFEQIQMVAALSDLMHQVLDTVEIYSFAAVRGLVHGSVAGVHALCHPIQSVESLARGMYYVFETAALNDCAEEFGFEDLYVDLRDQRNAEIAAALSALGQKISQVSGPEIVEGLCSFGASFYVPGKAITAMGSVLGALQLAVEVVPPVEGTLAVAGEAGQVSNVSADVIQTVQRIEKEVTKKVTQEVAKTMWRTTKKLKHAKKQARYAIEGRPRKATEPRTLVQKKASALEKAKRLAQAGKTRDLPDGRIRYYEPERPSDGPGPTRGRSFVTEFDPKTNRVRQWNEYYDHVGNINRVRPKMINGREVVSQHYPATYKDIQNNLKGSKWRIPENNLD